MSKTKHGKIVIMVGPSGSGKSTLIGLLKKDFPELQESISYTTRAPRGVEQNGVNYFFVTTEIFEEMIAKKDFLEWAKVHKNYYGTSKKFVQDSLKQGKSLLFDIDVQGADSFVAFFKDEANVIFVAPPSLEVLEKRLRGRGTDDEATIQTRLNNAIGELKRQNDYSYLIVNNDLDSSYSQLKNIASKLLRG